jgi:hypothetical protein
VFTQDQVSIVGYDGKPMTVSNPLVKYVNPKLDANNQPLRMGDPKMGGLYQIFDDNDGEGRILPVSATRLPGLPDRS